MISDAIGPLQSELVTCQDVTDPPSLDTATTTRLNDGRGHTLDSFTQDISHAAQYSPFDGLSDEVKSKPIPTKPVDFSRSYSSEASSPARSLSSLSPNKDRHHSLSSYADNLKPIGPHGDRPLLEPASPG